MTIASQTTQIRYPGNSTTTQWAFANKIFSAADLDVSIIDNLGLVWPCTNFTATVAGVVYSYTVQNVDVDSGCSITLTPALPSTFFVDIRSDIAELQSTSIKNQGSFLPELHEEFFDKATRMLQDLLRKTYTFGMHGPDNETVAWPAFPAISVRKNTQPIFDNNGLPAIGTLTSSSLSIASLAPLLGLLPTAAEIAAGVTPVAQQYPPTTPIDLRRYGQVGTALADTTALTSALAVVNGSGVIALPANYAGSNPATLPAGVSVIDYRVGGTFPTGADLLGAGRWINVGGHPEAALAGFHVQQWETSPNDTTSAILGTNKVTGNLSAGGGAMAAGTFELDTYGNITAASGNIYQALGGQFAIRSLGETLSLVVGVEGGGGIDRPTATTNILTAVGVQGDGVTNASTAGATITNAFGGRFIQSTASGITNNNFALSCEGDAMFRIGDSLRIENGSGLATIAMTFTSATLVSMPAGVKLGLASSLGINGATPPAQPTGYGTPTGGAHQASFAAGAISLPNLAAAVAQLIVELKAYGLLGA